MTRILEIYRSGEVRRWHTNPAMAHVTDTVAAHSSRVAKIILRLHPNPSMALIVAALTHDDGESLTGDVPYPAKRDNPELAMILGRIEAQEIARLWGSDTRKHVTAANLRWLIFADRMDALITIATHALPETRSPAWAKYINDLHSAARELGVLDEYDRLMADLFEGQL